MKWNINTKKQRGAALLVCLVVLLVMSVIGITSVSNSSLQQRMSFNLRQQQLAENAAEFALREAEKNLAATITSYNSLVNYAGAGGGLYASVIDTQLEITSTRLPTDHFTGADVTDPDSWVSANSVEVTGISSNATGKNPRYIIEFIGRMDPPGQVKNKVKTLSANTQDTIHFVFRVTAIGWGVDTNAYSVLQSTFRSADFLVAQ